MLIENLKPDTYYHILNAANGFENLFVEKDNYRYFLERYHFYISPIAHTLAYCLLANHFHIMIKIKPIDELELIYLNPKDFKNLSGLDEKEKEDKISLYLSQQFGNFFNSYSKSFNKKYSRRGSLFQKPFKRISVNNIDYKRNLIAYIHANAVKHQFVERLGEWEHCSYNSIVCEDQNRIINITKAIDLFDNFNHFEAFHLNKENRLLNEDLMLE